MQATGEKILAKSLFKDLRGHGYSANQILSLTNELLELVTRDLHERYVETAVDAREAALSKKSDTE